MRLVRALRSLFVALLLAPIRVYRALVSPLLPKVCRFHPSCSVYAMGAISVHGPLKGAWLAARRISRCHPFNEGGLDPVPPREGQPAAELLEARAPALAALLKAPPPPWLWRAHEAHPTPPNTHEAP